MILQDMADRIKQHPDYPKAGMVLFHNGVVREHTREGEKVTALEVTVDHDRLENIIDEGKTRDGIVEILVWIAEGKTLSVGDDIMYIAVAGDIRETVIDTLAHTLNRIKKEATSKKQFYV